MSIWDSKAPFIPGPPVSHNEIMLCILIGSSIQKSTLQYRHFYKVWLSSSGCEERWEDSSWVKCSLTSRPLCCLPCTQQGKLRVSHHKLFSFCVMWWKIPWLKKNATAKAKKLFARGWSWCKANPWFILLYIFWMYLTFIIYLLYFCFAWEKVMIWQYIQVSPERLSHSYYWIEVFQLFPWPQVY